MLLLLVSQVGDMKERLHSLDSRMRWGKNKAAFIRVWVRWGQVEGSGLSSMLRWSKYACNLEPNQNK